MSRLVEFAAMMRARCETQDVVCDAVVAKLKLDTAAKIYRQALSLYGIDLPDSIPVWEMRDAFLKIKRCNGVVAGVPLQTLH
jgi:hypothetical protein